MALIETNVGTGRQRLVQLYAVSVVAAGAIITASQLGSVLTTARSAPTFWLMAGLAMLAGAGAFVTSRPGGTAIVISPTACFTFAILLCWGLGPALIAQLGAVAVVMWRHRTRAWESAIVGGQYALAFTVASVVLQIGQPDPFGVHKPPNMWADAGDTFGAVAAWLLVFGVLTAVDTWLRHGFRQPRWAASVVGDQILFKAALLLLSPVFAVAAHVNVAFVPLVFVPMLAVERMARLSAERDRAARLDPLTGLPNRTGLKARFDELIGPTADPKLGRTALFVLDLDRFKHVNDALGHDVGDQLLTTVAARLAEVEPATGIVARLGGDEFALLAQVHHAAQAEALAARVVETLGRPVCLDGLRLDVTASIGIAIRFDHGETFAALMRHADVAMYQAKQRGDMVCVYEPGTDTNTPERFGLLSDFRRALERDNDGQIAMHYQPQVSLATGAVVGVEALLRWNHPKHGTVSTTELLRVAEHTAVMQSLTRRVIDDVVAQVARWSAAGVSLRASLNISARDLYSGDVVAHLARRLREHQVRPELIQIEITESALMADPARALVTTARIADLGVAVALDDFGTGYSSLQHLRKLPLSEVKIDRSFVAGMAANSDDAAIVASTVGLARSLGLRTVAEGVETEYTRGQLAAMGCTLAQGWHTARAMPGDEIPAWLAARPGAGPPHPRTPHTPVPARAERSRSATSRRRSTVPAPARIQNMTPTVPDAGGSPGQHNAGQHNEAQHNGRPVLD
jgi:diguanylate cyclase (GGDEF)-like protein